MKETFYRMIMEATATTNTNGVQRKPLVLERNPRNLWVRNWQPILGTIR